MKARVSLVLFGLLSACAEIEDHVLNLPASATHVGLLEFDGETFIGATPLVPWRSDAPLELAIGAEHRGYLLAYDQASLDSLGGAGEVIASVALEMPGAEPCATTLPVPVWAGAWTTEVEALDPADAPRATSAWRRASCERPDAPALRFDLRGGASLCESNPMVEVLDPCRVRATLCPAGPEPLEVILGDARPEAWCVATGEGSARSCRAVDADPGAVAAFECDGLGTFDVVDLSVEVPRKTRATTFPVSLRPEETISGPTPPSTFGLLPFGNRVLVSRDENRHSGCGPSSREEVRELASLDAETGAIASTATVPPCFALMVEGVVEGEFLASFYRDGDLRVGRFEASGRELASVALPFSSAVDDEVQVRGLAKAGTPARIGALITRERRRSVDDETVADESRLFQLDPTSLSILGPPIDFEDPVSTPVHLGTGPDAFLLSGGWSQRLFVVPAGDTGPPNEISLPPLEGLEFSPIYAAVQLSDGTIAASSVRGPVRFLTADNELWYGGPTHLGLSSASPGIEWPALGAGTLTLIARGAAGVGDSEIVVIDTNTRRTSNAERLGGRIDRVQLHIGPSGALWVLEPKRGVLYRIDAL